MTSWPVVSRRIDGRHTAAGVLLVFMAFFTLSEPWSIPVALLTWTCAAGVIWLAGEYIACAVAAFRGLRGPQPPQTRRMPAWRWAVTPVLLLLILAMAWTKAPMRICFACSRGSLETAAHEILAGRSVQTPGYIGYYYVWHIWIVSDTVFFDVAADASHRGFGYYWAGKYDLYANEPGALAPRWRIVGYEE